MTADRRNLLLLAIAWIVAILLVDPRGEFPTTDDWAYATSVRALVVEGRLFYHDWSAANLLTHFLWGGLFGAVLGPSYLALRLSTLLAALLGGMAVYRLVRSAPAEPSVALLATAVWLFNPLCMALSFGFMSDIGFAALTFGALALLAEGARRSSRSLAAGGWMIGIAALLSRQLGIAVPVGWAAGRFAARRGWHWRMLGLLAPAILFVAVQIGFQRWLVASGHAPALYGRQASGVASLLLHPIDLLRLAAGMIPKTFLYCGALGFPLALALFPGWLGALPPRRRWVAIGAAAGVVLLALAGLAWRGMVFPIWPNTLGYFGIGPDIAGVLTPRPVLWALTMLAVVGGALVALLAGTAVVAIVRRIVRPSGDRQFDVPAAALGVAVTLVGLVMIVAMRFDRYMIPILGCALILTAAGMAGRVPCRRALVAGAIGAAAMAALSICAVHDVMAAKRIQGDAFARIAARVGPRNVDGGWVLNGPTWFRCFLALPDRAPDAWLHAANVVEPADAPRPGYAIVERLPVPRWLPWDRAGRPILVQRDPAGRTFSTDPAIDPAACRP